MSVWDKYKKRCVHLIAYKYLHLFSMLKKKFCKFLNGFSLTQLKNYIEQQHEKTIKKHLKSYHFMRLWLKNHILNLLKKIHILFKLPFYDKLSITLKAFKGYACSYRVEVIELKDLSAQLMISRPSIKDLFKDFL